MGGLNIFPFRLSNIVEGHKNIIIYYDNTSETSRVRADMLCVVRIDMRRGDNVAVELADASLLPESLGLPPILTIMALAKRISKIILQ